MERVKLKKLLKDIAGISVRGSKEIEITGVCSHSKRVAPGNLFIAKKGLTCDGAQFMADAIASGAVASAASSLCADVVPSVCICLAVFPWRLDVVAFINLSPRKYRRRCRLRLHRLFLQCVLYFAPL